LGSRFYLRALLIWWAVGMFAVLSWAGEKMPWLTVHIALPLLLLAASYLGAALSWIAVQSLLRTIGTWIWRIPH